MHLDQVIEAFNIFLKIPRVGTVVTDTISNSSIRIVFILCPPGIIIGMFYVELIDIYVAVGTPHSDWLIILYYKSNYTCKYLSFP